VIVVNTQTLGQVITAVGGLGTAAFGLVESSKSVLPINFIGLSGIKATVKALIPPSPPGTTVSSLSQEKVLCTVEANWINGNDLSSQKAIAKSLIKLNLSPGNAAALGATTGVDPVILTDVATSIATGTSLTSAQSDVYARFDLILTATLDEAYQRSDQIYRNGTKTLAMLFALALAVVGGITLDGWLVWHTSLREIAASLLIGLLATPLAPIAKDISSALATAVNTMQLVKK
jgi:hypothetical protein